MNADTLMDDTDQDSIDSFNYTSVPTYTERENNSFIGSENNSGNQSGTSSEKNSIPLDKQTLKTAEMLKENIKNLEDVFSAARNSDEISTKSHQGYHSHQSYIAGENKPYNSVEEEFIADNMDNTTAMSSNLNNEKMSTALKPVSSSSSLSTKESDSTKSRKRKR